MKVKIKFTAEVIIRNAHKLPEIQEARAEFEKALKRNVWDDLAVTDYEQEVTDDED